MLQLKNNPLQRMINNISQGKFNRWNIKVPQGKLHKKISTKKCNLNQVVSLIQIFHN